MDNLCAPTDTFVRRHLGPSEDEIAAMLAALGFDSLDALTDAVVPRSIRLKRPPRIGRADAADRPQSPRGEYELLAELREIARQNRLCRSLIGMGYYDTITPPVIQRNILENPGWYTQYTPYQAEISQGRLEALLNFQTMVADLTALPLANASLLDEATAAAEAMTMCHRIARGRKNAFYVADDCHPQTIAVIQTRAEPLGIELRIGPAEEADFAAGDLCGILLQYPNTCGQIRDYRAIVEQAHAAGALVVAATDLLALTLIEPPGEWGADIAVGGAQRFGVPLGYGGPHAAFLATHEQHARQVPGRIIGVSHDAHGNIAYRMSIQTREQHIRREKATSNICTAQALLAIMASMYAVYHGPQGLRRIAERVQGLTAALAEGLRRLGHQVHAAPYFDTLHVRLTGMTQADARARARDRGFNLREFDDGAIGISLDEKSSPAEVLAICEFLTPGQDPRAPDAGEGQSAAKPPGLRFDEIARAADAALPPALRRTSDYLTHPVFNSHHAEHEMLRYIKQLEARDLSLTHSMIPLGSCTMKLNATSEMLPVTWPEFANIHPFAPLDQTRGYQRVFADLERWLAELTGLPAVSLQPNAGAQGEYAGLLVIRAYHRARGQEQRDVCLIPVSAHGTNPASAVMAGMRVVAVQCDRHGNVELADLREKAAQHAARLAALMITYPSTHGVFEEDVREICAAIHEHGGLVYMDGANMNAQLGLTSPGEIGADVCHLNLHKTFCIPHGGGGPGMGPIAVAAHLAEFLPGHPVVGNREQGTGNRKGGRETDGHVAQPPSAVNVAQPPSAVSSRSPSTGSPAKPATASYRRNLPHLQGPDRTCFVTFRTYQSWRLPAQVRQRVLEHCLHDHGTKLQMHAAVVMPDHVHLLFTPMRDDAGAQYGLAEILSGIKGASAHSINKMLERKGSVWQEESFDHILRREESLEEKAEYICQNPVRKKLVTSEHEYPWLWRAGAGPEVTRPGAAGSAQPGAAVPHAQPGAAGSAQPGAAVARAIGPVSAAPWGSPSILPISWVYIALMGADGLKQASQVAILNANYMARRLADHYPLVYTGKSGWVAHEFIIDCRTFKQSAGIEIEDIAKRLMDYGFHAPTMSWPVPGTLMIEPTESESKPELDRLCDALIAIRQEIRAIEQGTADRENNPLKHSPHTAAAVTADAWDHPYSRTQAAWPAPWLAAHKFWPPVGRVDNVYGDRHLMCTCPSVESLAAGESSE